MQGRAAASLRLCLCKNWDLAEPVYRPANADVIDNFPGNDYSIVRFPEKLGFQRMGGWIWK